MNFNNSGLVDYKPMEFGTFVPYMYRFVIIVKYLTNFFKLEWNLGIKFTLRFFFLSVYNGDHSFMTVVFWHLGNRDWHYSYITHDFKLQSNLCSTSADKAVFVRALWSVSTLLGEYTVSMSEESSFGGQADLLLLSSSREDDCNIVRGEISVAFVSLSSVLKPLKTYTVCIVSVWTDTPKKSM